MKPNIRWQLLLALVCLGLVLSLLSVQVQTADLCTTRVPAGGGTFSEGLIGAPKYVNPLLSVSNPVDAELVSLLFDGLTRYDETGQLVPALASTWQVSEDGREVTFTLRDDVIWHDGRPFSATDVAFTYSLLQQADFPAPAGLKNLWQSVVITQTGPLEIIFTLPEPYSPFLQATTQGILPAHILAALPAGQIADNPAFNRQPIGTGPFQVAPGDNWPRTGRLHLIPNPAYWQQGIQLDSLEFRFYPDSQSLIADYQAGEIQAMNNVPADVLPTVAALPDVRLFTAPAGRFQQLVFNLSNTGLVALTELEVRQALAFALDRPDLVARVLNGQAIPLEGPYLPSSWAYQPLTSYSYQPLTATTLLDEAGWVIPAGSTIRQKEGTPFTLRLLFLETPTNQLLATTIAEQWAAVGLRVELLASGRDDYLAALTNRAYDVALLEVVPAGDPDLYAFWSQEAIVKGQNYGAWNNRRASEALEQARQLWSVEERKPFYDLFLHYFDQDLPAITLYQQLYTYVLSPAVNEAEIGRIDSPRDRYTSLADWFLLYREITVGCP